MINRKILRFVIIALAAGLGLALSAKLFNTKGTVNPPPALEVVTLLPTPRALPAFALDSNTGPITQQSLTGHWTVIFIGFSHCPDICPTTLTDLARAQKLWRDPYLIEIPAMTVDEPRYLVIGRIGAKHWSAVITYRSENVRIISVRRSRLEEVALYEG